MKFFKVIILAALIVSAAQAKADIEATHGMVLFGDKTTYLSHLPMFHAPHDYQVVMKVHLSDIPRSVTLYQHYKAAKEDGSTFFTVVPQKSDLTKIISGEITEFSAQLYDGHFEKGGKVLGWIDVKIEELIIAEKLLSHIPEEHKYLAFGENYEYFAVHLIQGKPSYDKILSIGEPWKEMCKRCYDLVITPLFLPITLTGSKEVEPNQYLGKLSGYSAKVNKIIYFEENELN